LPSQQPPKVRSWGVESLGGGGENLFYKI
jgi:hypothetical protein